jgi:hypothetical protein
MSKIKFEFERDTKNTIRFKEVLNGPLDTPKIGTLYVSKGTLKDIGYTEGKKLEVEVKVCD